jgi:hypothetical protein
MTLIIRTLLFCTLYGILTYSQSAVFPTIRDRSLANTPIAIPDPNGDTLVIMGFDKDAGDAMTDWITALNQPDSPTIHWVYLPVIGSVPPFVDRLIKRGLKSAVPQPHHSQVLAYFGSQKPLIRAALPDTITDTAIPVIAIITPSGQVAHAWQVLATPDHVATVQAIWLTRHPPLD